MIFFYAIYIIATELNSTSTSTAEFLVFRRGHVPKYMQQNNDVESGENPNTQVASAAEDHGEHADEVEAIPPQKDIFTWRDVCLDITIQGEPRRLLDNVSGWVKPGTLTALMGVSGAGKTTLLDTLSQRTSVGVLTGDMFVNGKSLDASFQRKTGYVQQQDLHLETTTVREALRFSAMLRQPKTVSVKEKHEFVEDVIKMLNMEDFSEAIVGTPGEGLNVEQRKLLTIGVELAAKPALLLFLDEPTSGLDSQSSWSIVAFLRKLADSGQAVLSTIHQPSAILFQEFDRLLFLAKGGKRSLRRSVWAATFRSNHPTRTEPVLIACPGKTVYFGDIGKNSRTLLDYFESGGARKCGDDENPAEYMLEIVGVGSHNKSAQDWPQLWKDSQEKKGVQTELDRIHKEKQGEPVTESGAAGEFAMPLTAQIYYVTVRVFEQYWRTPDYILGKFILCECHSSGLTSAFARPWYRLLAITANMYIRYHVSALHRFLVLPSEFQPDRTTEHNLWNLHVDDHLLGTRPASKPITFFPAINRPNNSVQIMPRFVLQRSLYEVRERPSKAYSWIAFLFANIAVEIPYQILASILVYASWYFPIFGANQSTETQGIMLLFCIQFFVFASTFSQMVIAVLPDAETAGNIATLLFSLVLTFNGVLQTPSALPGFWVSL